MRSRREEAATKKAVAYTFSHSTHICTIFWPSPHPNTLLLRPWNLTIMTPPEPRVYYFETVECGRRCLMTGALGGGILPESQTRSIWQDLLLKHFKPSSNKGVKDIKMLAPSYFTHSSYSSFSLHPVSFRTTKYGRSSGRGVYLRLR